MKNCLLTASLVQGRQRCRLETSFDPTWAQERILKIIETLGRKAKLSIFCEFDSVAIAFCPSHTPNLSVGIAVWVLVSFLSDCYQSSHAV